VCIATNRSEKSIGTIILRRYWIPSAKLLNGTIPAEKLQEVLRTDWPVCWNCHVAETFRREHPELVVNRPEAPLRMSILK